MSVNSNILIEEVERVNKINVDNMNMYEKTIKSHQEDIKRYKDEIITNQKEIDKLDEKKRNYIKNLRKIMENQDNHEENMICKKLKNESLSEYKMEMANLKELIEYDINRTDGLYNTFKNKIISQRELIYEKEKMIKDIENYRENVYNEMIESGRKRILNLCIDYLQDYQNTEAHIKYLQDLMNEKIKSN